jgi:hypothetical protein
MSAFFRFTLRGHGTQLGVTALSGSIFTHGLPVERVKPNRQADM